MEASTGKEILAGLSEARRFLDQVALLIQTGEDLLLEAGWEGMNGNKCSDLSAHLYRPRKWMPSDVHRFYTAGADNEDNRNVILFVSVLLDNERDWGGFQEPWVSCGLYKFETEEEAKAFKDWKWAKAALEDKHDPDGTFHDGTIDPEKREEYSGLVYEAMMALPLLEIGSAEDLKEKIIDPLLKKLDSPE